MRYYAIANPFPLIKMDPADNMLDDLPFIGIPLYGKLPITKASIQEAYNQSEDLTLCKSLDDAMRLRQIKIDKNVVTRPDFFNTVANCPSADYAIYEVEIDERIKINFQTLVNAPNHHLRQLVSMDIYKTTVVIGDRTELPDVDYCFGKKVFFNPELIQCHYFPLDGGVENTYTNKKTSCCQLF